MSSQLSKCLEAITEKTSYTYNKKDCSGYMLMMWLSHDPELVGICNDINPHIFTLSDELIFKYFYKKVPQKRRFIKWTKKTKISEAKEKEVQMLMDDYGVSSREARLSAK